MLRGVSAGGPRYTLATKAGRLIEARVFHLRSPAEADEYAGALASQVARLPVHLRGVLCADHRPVVVYTQSVTDRLGELFLQMNQRLERIAILVARTNATLLVQLERMVREAANTNRKVFHVAEGALEHLGPVLDGSELVRARAFVSEWKG
jgi:hypothetical protein